MIHFYHPNKAVKGFACSFWRSDRHGDLFATLIKQSGWDTSLKRGTFKASLDDPNKRITIKLSEIEAAGILDCIENNRPFNSFHSFDDFPKSISFIPWMTTPASIDGEEAKSVQQGFSFAVTVSNKADASAKNHFYIGFTYAEARYLAEFLLHYLRTTFRRTPSAQGSAPESENNPTAVSSN
jgi:hypothetical protein